jgi:hypothetical protein
MSNSQSFKLTITDTDRKVLLPVFAVVGVLAVSATGAYAQSAVTQLVTEADQIDGVYDAIIPAAVGSIVFSIGAMMIKRVAFA